MTKREQLEALVTPLSKTPLTVDKYTRLLEALFDAIDPLKIGTPFADALAADDYASAVHILADYYRAKPSFPINGKTGASDSAGYDAKMVEKYLCGSVTVVNIEWTFENGEEDYLFDPTDIHGPKNNEWLWQHSRHYEWTMLVAAYTETKDERLAQVFADRLLRWLAQTDIPDNWNGPGSTWRTIECGIRLLGSWPKAFDGFRASPSVSDTVLLLMIASMHKQTVHLVAHPTARNWLMMESNGVYTFASLFPEFKDAEQNRRIAAERLLHEMEVQILPDGMQNELSPDYQGVVFHCAANFYEMAQSLGFAHEIPSAFAELLRKTVHAAILLSTPALTQPRTNDTYTIPTHHFTARAAKMLGDTPEYLFINSRRAEGEPPTGKTASALLPYAGFAVMRSDWSADAAYLCFDVGPLGAAHVHQDMLNIILFKGSRELLYDDGGGQYEISPARTYALSSYAHNVALVDGMPQKRSAPAEYKEPANAHWITNERFDYAAATYVDAYGDEGKMPAMHTREVRFFKPDFFCVADTLSSTDGEAHDYKLLFHLDTTCITPIEGYRNAVLSAFGGDYELAMIPLDGEANVTLKTVSAATKPMMQGWYNGRNESSLHEAITVSREVKRVREAKLVTLLIPVKRGDALPTVARNADGTATVFVNGRSYTVDVNALNA